MEKFEEILQIPGNAVLDLGKTSDPILRKQIGLMASSPRTMARVMAWAKSEQDDLSSRAVGRAFFYSVIDGALKGIPVEGADETRGILFGERWMKSAVRLVTGKAYPELIDLQNELFDLLETKAASIGRTAAPSLSFEARGLLQGPADQLRLGAPGGAVPPQDLPPPSQRPTWQDRLFEGEVSGPLRRQFYGPGGPIDKMKRASQFTVEQAFADLEGNLGGIRSEIQQGGLAASFYLTVLFVLLVIQIIIAKSRRGLAATRPPRLRRLRRRSRGARRRRPHRRSARRPSSVRVRV